MNLTQQYKTLLDNVHFDDNFESDTVELLKSAAGRKENETVRNTKTLKIIVAVAAIVAMLSASAFAISALLTPSFVAQHFGENQVAQMFESQENEVQTVTQNGYTVSLLGVTHGHKLNKTDGLNIDESKSYYIVAVAKEDGTPLSIVDGNPLGMSVLVNGCDSWKVNTWSLNTNANGMEENGVLYYMYECDSLGVFANMGVYFAVYDGFVPGPEIFTMNEDGTFRFAEGYKGFKAIFTLSLDKSLADDAKAQQIIAQLYSQRTEADTPESETGSGFEIEYLGIRDGREFDIIDENRAEGPFYYVYAVEKEGEKLSISNPQVKMIPVIDGYPPERVNGYKFDVVPTTVAKDGALYFLIDCESVDVFAGQKVSLAVVDYETVFYDAIEIKNDGTIGFTADYSGFGRIIRMELDESKADVQLAKKTLNSLMPDLSQKFGAGVSVPVEN